MELPPRVRGYTVERLLGQGSTGFVWQARATGSGARVALKRIAVRNAEQSRRAQDEAGLLAALDHPNLVRLHAVVPADDAVVLVLDLAEGGSLADLLAARGRLAPGEVITALAPIAAALAYLHDEHVVHGDVSPGNILFTAGGVALLADVGVARLTGVRADPYATPAYVDPAVAAGSVAAAQSDVFMLGAVALHALTGTAPWPGPDANAALAAAAAGDLDDIAERLTAAGVEPAMAAPVCRALAVDPHRRGTAADLALDLAHGGQAVAVELAAGSGPIRSGPRHAADPTPPTRMVAPRPRPVIPHPTRRRRPRPSTLAATAVALLVAAGLTVGLAGRAREHESARAARVSVLPRPEVETSTVRSAHRGAPATSSSPVPRPADPLVELDRLDALRARAFARGDPGLLRRVYLPGRLLRADATQLTRLVPTGCGLTGVRSQFVPVATRHQADRDVLTVTATLHSSRLVCAGHARGTAPGTAPTRLTIALVRTNAGVRIADERRA